MGDSKQAQFQWNEWRDETDTENTENFFTKRWLQREAREVLRHWRGCREERSYSMLVSECKSFNSSIFV